MFGMGGRCGMMWKPIICGSFFSENHKVSTSMFVYPEVVFPWFLDNKSWSSPWSFPNLHDLWWPSCFGLRLKSSFWMCLGGPLPQDFFTFLDSVGGSGTPRGFGHRLDDHRLEQKTELIGPWSLGIQDLFLAMRGCASKLACGRYSWRSCSLCCSVILWAAGKTPTYQRGHSPSVTVISRLILCLLSIGSCIFQCFNLHTSIMKGIDLYRKNHRVHRFYFGIGLLSVGNVLDSPKTMFGPFWSLWNYECNSWR